MKIKNLMLIMTTAACVSVFGCKDQGPVEEAGESVSEAAEDAGDALEEGAEKVEEGAEKAGEAVEDAMN